ncbi:MAG TPA: VOC family protein [Acidimicrobiia bacterium]|nr:VOC family protein [Acidimicrobiia bacterium]
MAITRLNHAVLYVRDAAKAAQFYKDVFEMESLVEMPGAVFLKAKGSLNDHDLGLFSLGDDAPIIPRGAAVGLYHLAWQVETLSDLVDFEKKLKELGAFVGATDHGVTKSVYGHDIDNNEFEIMWIVPSELIGSGDEMKTTRLDMDKEIARFGADTPARILT